MTIEGALETAVCKVAPSDQGRLSGQYSHTFAPNPACKRTRDESVDIPHKTLRGAEVLEEEHEEDMIIKDNVDPAEITSDDEQMLFAGEHEVQSRLTRYSQGTTVTRQELEDIQSDSDILADRDFPPL